jgi:DNA-binding MarR family transcriptional regulator
MLTGGVIRDLARFRYELRKFLRFSERAAKSHGLTPLQHQLLLGVAGFNGTRRATVSELAEFLQERHNSVVELVGRAVSNGLVTKNHQAGDRRYVYVSLTPRGEAILSKLTGLHRAEVERLRAGLLASRKHGVDPTGTKSPVRHKNGRKKR